MLSEEEFFRQAVAFLDEIAELADGEPTPDQDLLESGLLDSLTTVEFLAFIEDKRGRPFPPGTLSTASVATMRRAYDLVIAP